MKKRSPWFLGVTLRKKQTTLDHTLGLFHKPSLRSVSFTNLGFLGTSLAFSMVSWMAVTDFPKASNTDWVAVFTFSSKMKSNDPAWELTAPLWSAAPDLNSDNCQVQFLTSFEVDIVLVLMWVKVSRTWYNSFTIFFCWSSGKTSAQQLEIQLCEHAKHLSNFHDSSPERLHFWYKQHPHS